VNKLNRASTGGELVDRFLALFDKSLQDLNGLGFVERFYFFHFFEFDRRFYSAQHAQAQFILRAHGVDQIFLNFLRKTHGILLTARLYQSEGAAWQSPKLLLFLY
jgi:hypothetical protein